ncbi:hypothetical protein Poly51_63360 [Rubripirellula tenax]|uniref:Uncharacterized protein n=1 Tax=Rubripirellula tenax TaxID=2528015 RepID=A0A5C6E3U2_9BACT|nr:hypothetical protein [Rubripirellula tenax]TWU43558.1 hypothetical protein Poly51_63360 [Rubripirellula tenax]
MLPAKTRRRRDELLPIGLVEHHLLGDRALSSYDIAERLIPIHDAVIESADSVAIDSKSVMIINNSVTDALGQPVGEFVRIEDWDSLNEMIEDCGGFTEDPAHIAGWLFSSLYWDNLTACRFATAWFFTDAILINHRMPMLELQNKDIGGFLSALSGSGPPILDGQTFFPTQYKRETVSGG